MWIQADVKSISQMQEYSQQDLCHNDVIISCDASFDVPSQLNSKCQTACHVKRKIMADMSPGDVFGAQDIGQRGAVAIRIHLQAL